MKFPAIDKIIEHVEDLRPALGFVWVDKETTFASDAHVMVIHKTAKLFRPQFIESLGDERIGLQKEIIKALRGRIDYSMIYHKEENKIILSPKFFKPEYAELHFKVLSLGVEPPDFKRVLDSAKKGKEVLSIAFKPGLLDILNKALGNTSYDVLLMKFNSKTQGIYCKNSESSHYPDAEGVIMPCMNDEII